MDHPLKNFLWEQIGASIDMLENAIAACSNDNWNSESQFWYVCYHTLFFLDYYLDENPDQFAPPQPFTMSEFDPANLRPYQVYTKVELTEYCEYCRSKCKSVVGKLNCQNAENRFINDYRDYSFLEILIYNLRHVQHHVGQLQLLLRQSNDTVPNWINETKLSLENQA